MFQFVLKRIVHSIPVLFLVATLTFFIIRVAPGGPFSLEKDVPEEILATLNKHYGLDKPLYAQYFDYIRGLLKGDLGPSFQYPNRTVSEMIIESFPVSIELGLEAILFALIVGMLVGIVASTAPNSLRDYVPMSFVMMGICIPSFVLGPVLIWIFAIKLPWFNSSGWTSVSDRILPVITLGSMYAANIARLVRTSMLEMLSQDFVRTARAKGLTECGIVMKHCLKGGVAPVISYLGPTIAGLITGAFVVETIFQIPGLGKLFVLAAFNRDYTMISGTVLFFAVMIVILNTIVDIIRILLDPKRSFDEKQ